MNYSLRFRLVLTATAVSDFNADGNTDVAVANVGLGNNIGDGSVSVFAGNGDGTFKTAVDYRAGAAPIFVAVGDFNGDGRSDLAIANNQSNSISLLLGNGDGTFQMAFNFSAGMYPTSVASGDFNGDGKPDLALSNYGSGNMSVLLNTCTASDRLLVRLAILAEGSGGYFLRFTGAPDVIYRLQRATSVAGRGQPSPRTPRPPPALSNCMTYPHPRARPSTAPASLEPFPRRPALARLELGRADLPVGLDAHERVSTAAKGLNSRDLGGFSRPAAELTVGATAGLCPRQRSKTSQPFGNPSSVIVYMNWKANELNTMSQRFDERARGIGASAARRGAMKIFGAGLAAIALASLALANGDGLLNHPEGDGLATALAEEPWIISDNQGAMKLYCNFRETCS